MIKLSTMARQTPTTTLEQVVEQARLLQLDGVDFHLSGMDRSVKYINRIKSLCLERGLNIGYAGAGSFVGPPEGRAARLQQGRADVDAAALLGAQVLRVFARHKWPSTVEEQEALWHPMIEDFQAIADYAAQRGVMIALQNHDNGSFAMTADQVLAHPARDRARQFQLSVGYRGSGWGLLAHIRAASSIRMSICTKTIWNRLRLLPRTCGPRSIRSTAVLRSLSTTGAC